MKEYGTQKSNEEKMKERRIILSKI